MSNPQTRELREEELIEGLKRLFFGLQRSEEIYKEFSKLKPKAQKMDKKEIDTASRAIASRVESFYAKRKSAGKPASPEEVKIKLKEELEKFAES